MPDDKTHSDYGGGDAAAGSDRPGVHPFRDRQRDAAIVFIHGFGSNSDKTWGSFLSIISEEPTLADWDIYSVGYSTGLLMDIAGLWKASPPIGRLSEYLGTAILNQPLDRYDSLLAGAPFFALAYGIMAQ